MDGICSEDKFSDLCLSCVRNNMWLFYLQVTDMQKGDKKVNIDSSWSFSWILLFSYCVCSHTKLAVCHAAFVNLSAKKVLQAY